MNTKELKRHRLNPLTHVCSCGRTFEQHKNIDLLSDYYKERMLNGDVNVDDMIEDIQKALYE